MSTTTRPLPVAAADGGLPVPPPPAAPDATGHDPAGHDAAAARSLGTFTAAVAAVLAAIVVLSVHASLPENALRLPAGEAVAMRAWLPQGWGYFSGDARAPAPSAYVADADGRWQPVALGHQGSPAALLGLDRAGRLAEQEVGLLEARATTAPRDCRGPDAACLEDLRAGEPVENPATEPRLCGDVAIVRRDPVPWAWAGRADPADMPATAVRLEVSC